MQKLRDNKKDLLADMMCQFGEEGLSKVFCDAVRLLSSWESARDMPDLVLRSVNNLMCLEGYVNDAIKSRGSDEL